MNREGSPQVEWLKCAQSPVYFAMHYTYIYNATRSEWVPFKLWPEQQGILRDLQGHRQAIILKARQLGISWLVIAFCLWTLLFEAPATVLLFSLRQVEAEELLWRLRGMYRLLPEWMQAKSVVRQNDSRWELSNGSSALSFPTSGGRSYTGTMVLVDEADFVPNLADFLNAVKPTTDAGGRLVLVSTSDKAKPLSTFKSVFRAAWRGLNTYKAIFLPWYARPDRDKAWYETIRADMRAQRGSDDDLHQEYPATPEEALAARTLDKRIPAHWVELCSAEATSLPAGGRWQVAGGAEVPSLPGLSVFRLPEPGQWYVIGADPAEGNPTSDESSATVLDVDTLEQVAVLSGKFQPAVFAAYVDALGVWYNHADVLPERNNHGHSFLLWMADNGRLQVLAGFDNKAGWLSNVKGKTLMYDKVADVCRDGLALIHDSETFIQLASIEASTLRAPEGMHDDRADAFGLAVAGALLCAGVGASASSASEAPADPIAEAEKQGW